MTDGERQGKVRLRGLRWPDVQHLMLWDQAAIDVEAVKTARRKQQRKLAVVMAKVNALWQVFRTSPRD